jgi:hypothetical protein
MLLRNLPKFIHLRLSSKLRFNKINTKSDITPPNNLDMVTFEFLLASCWSVSQWRLASLFAHVQSHLSVAQVI